MEKLRFRVLIADDEKNIRELLRDELASTMTHVAAVESGTAALAELERSDYDVLLLDLTMPVMDGMEVLKRLKSLDILRRSHHPYRQRDRPDSSRGHEARGLRLPHEAF